jgi:hypothetical protein
MAHNDFAILKHYFDPKEPELRRPFERIVNENELVKMFESCKPNNREWQSIEYV